MLEFAGTRERVAFQVKSRANAAIAWQVVYEAAARPGRPVVLVAGESTADARRILREHGIGMVDSRGNAHIELPGLLVHMEGGQPASYAGHMRLSGKAAVVAQALLQPGRRWHIRDLAGEAGVSDGLAHRVLVRLEDERLVASEGAGMRRIRCVTDAGALLDLWAEEDGPRPQQTRAFVLAQGPRQLSAEMGVNLAARGLEYALTGAAGASIIAPSGQACSLRTGLSESRSIRLRLEAAPRPQSGAPVDKRDTPAFRDILAM